jgi:hypothetical protein
VRKSIREAACKAVPETAVNTRSDPGLLLIDYEGDKSPLRGCRVFPFAMRTLAER